MSLISFIKGLFSSSGPGKLNPGDKMLYCEDCDKQFVFDVGEQQFFKSRGFTEPKRCGECRKNVRGRMRRRRRGGRGRGRGGDGRGGDNNRGGENRGGRGYRGGRHSVIDGTSPYADER